MGTTSNTGPGTPELFPDIDGTGAPNGPSLSGRRVFQLAIPVVCLVIIGLVLMVGQLSAAPAAVDAQLTYVGCATFAGESEPCETGVTVSSARLFEPWEDDDPWSNDTCAGGRWNATAGARAIEVRDGCRGMFEISYSSDESGFANPFDANVGVSVHCDGALSSEVTRCDAGGPIGAVQDFMFDCPGGLRWQSGWDYFETKGCGTTHFIVWPLVCANTQRSADNGCIETPGGQTYAAEMRCTSDNEQLTRCTPTADFVTGALFQPNASSGCDGRVDGQSAWEIVDPATQTVEVFSGCDAVFTVFYKGDPGAFSVSSAEPYSLHSVHCAAPSPSEEGSCALAVDSVRRVAQATVTQGDGCETWSSTASSITVDGCSSRFNVYHEGEVVTNRGTFTCTTYSDSTGPSPWFRCMPDVDGITSINLIRELAAGTCKPADEPVRWHRDGDAVHVYAECQGEFEVLYTGPEKNTFDVPADQPFTASVIVCGASGSRTCSIPTGSRVESVHNTAGHGTATRCASSEWSHSTTAKTISVQGCTSRFIVYHDGATFGEVVEIDGAEQIKFPWDRNESWETFFEAGHTKVTETDYRPVPNRAGAEVLAPVGGRAEYFCSIEHNTVAGEAHALIFLETAYGRFEFHHLDVPDAETRYGGVGGTIQVVQGQVLGVLDGATGEFEDVDPIDGRFCHSHSDGVHLHMVVPTNVTEMDGVPIGKDVCATSCARTSTNERVGGNRTRPPEPAPPSPPAPGPEPEPTECALLTNGDFSAGTQAWRSTWGQSSVVDGELVVTGGIRVQDVAATADEVYTFTGIARTIGNTPARDAGIDFIDGAGNKISGFSGEVPASASDRQFLLSAVAPAGTQQVRVWVYSGNAGTTVFDDLSLTPAFCEVPIAPTPEPPENPAPAPACQLLANGNFDAGVDGWPVLWGSGTAEGGELVMRDGVRYQDVRAESGTSYTLTGRHRTIGNTPARDAGIDFLDASRQKLSGHSAGLGQSGDGATFTETATAPSGTVYVRVWAYSGRSGATAFDDLALSTC
ncbi:MAG: hypothetical protein AAF467_18765 [Actinomycetota bacterium]